MSGPPAASCPRATGSASAWRRRCIHDPDVLILDEPTTGLDPKQIIETRQLDRELAGDHTIILSTHILPEVAQTCERVVIINKGRVVAVDTPANLTGRLRGAETMFVQVEATRASEAAAALAKVPGVVRSRRSTTRRRAHSRSRARPGGTCVASSPRPSCSGGTTCSSCGRRG